MIKSKVPVFILAGGMGTRLSEETQLKPKPMVEIGDIPILLHIMRRYYAFGFNDFVICAGYRSWDIKEFFFNYEFRRNHVELDHRTNGDKAPVAFGRNIEQENWRVRVIDTGVDAMTGARVARAFDEVDRIEKIETFALTYGDGLSDVNFNEQTAFHEHHDRVGTVLGVRHLARFGELDLGEDGRVMSFVEKPQGKEGLINGGFFFFERKFREYLSTTADCILERQPLASLAQDGQLMMFQHRGFWQPMDTLRDKAVLQDLWSSGKAPWLSV